MAWGITAISYKQPPAGGRGTIGLYKVQLNGVTVFEGGSAEIAKKYGVNQKAIPLYVKTGHKLKRTYDIIRVN